MWWVGGCSRCEGDGDQGGFALGGWEGEQAGSEGGAEGPRCFGGEGAEFVVFAGFLGDQGVWLDGGGLVGWR